MEKSIGTILGELYRKAIEESERQEELRLGRQEALKAALSIFLKDFQPATPEERIAKAIALENIKNNKLTVFEGFGKNFRDDFKEAAGFEIEDEEPEDAVKNDFASYIEAETRDDRIQNVETLRASNIFPMGEKPLSIQEQQAAYIEEQLQEGAFDDELLDRVGLYGLSPSSLPFLGIDTGTILPSTSPEAVPLYLNGFEYGLFNGMSPEELISVQVALVEANYLAPGSFSAGVLDPKTQNAIASAMSLHNQQGRTNTTLNSSFVLQTAASGQAPALASDIRDFFLSEVAKDAGQDAVSIAIDESINLFPEFAALYGETAAEGILGRKIRSGERAMMGRYYSAAVEEASNIVLEMLNEREQSRKDAQVESLKMEEIRLKGGLPQGVYSLESPQQFTARPGDISAQDPAAIQTLITSLANQRFENKINSIGGYAAELQEGEKEREMTSRSRAFNTALNVVGGLGT